MPAWRGLQGIAHPVFTTRCGRPPAVRALMIIWLPTFLAS